MIFRWGSEAEVIGKAPGVEIVWEIETLYGRSVKYVYPEGPLVGSMEFFEFFDKAVYGLILDIQSSEAGEYQIDDQELIRFNFSQAINMELSPDGHEKVVADRSAWRFINNPAGTITTETFPDETFARYLTLCCRPEFLLQIAEDQNENVPNFLEDMIDPELASVVHRVYETSAKLERRLRDIFKLNANGKSRVFMLEALAMQILSVASDELKNPSAEYPKINLTQQDRRKFSKIHDLLSSELENPPSIKALAKDFALNRNKLYYGFKWIYGHTISEHIQIKRMEEAHLLLDTTDKSILEVANIVGYSHQSNFSTAFKNHYGYSPKEVR